MIVTDNLVFYWNSKYGVGSSWDNISPNTRGRYNGEMNGVLLEDKGVFFDGNSVVSTPMTPISTNNSFTTEMIVNLNEGDGYHTFFIMINESTMTGIQLYYANMFGVFVISNGMDTEDNNQYPYQIPYNSEIHVTCAYDGVNNQAKIYINGDLLYTADIELNANDMNQFQLGNIFINGVPYDISSGFHGHILLARLYDRELSKEEISQNFTIGSDIGIDIPEEPLPELPDGVVLRLYADGTMCIRGELIEGFNHISLKPNGDLMVNEIIEDSYFRISNNGNIYIKELIEGRDRHGKT